MMFKFGRRSLTNLSTCEEALQKLAHKALATSPKDFTIICGHRDKKDQDAAFASGNSQLRFPKSKHNKLPSEAFDFAPYPLDWDDLDSFKKIGHHILDTWDDMEESKDWDIEWGGEWRKFKDYPHIQITRRKNAS
jgi:peptidoglycan L-alanyl-D-glutamate endopeptidase CwlK